VHVLAHPFFIGKILMVLAQIERLEKDSAELEIYARKLEKKGFTQRAQKILKKRDFVLKTIGDLKPVNSY